MSTLSIVAPPAKRRELREIASKVRQVLGMDEDPYFHIVFAFEAALEDLTGFTYDVVPPGVLPPGIHGETRPDEKMGNYPVDVPLY